MNIVDYLLYSFFVYPPLILLGFLSVKLYYNFRVWKGLILLGKVVHVHSAFISFDFCAIFNILFTISYGGTIYDCRIIDYYCLCTVIRSRCNQKRPIYYLFWFSGFSYYSLYAYNVWRFIINQISKMSEVNLLLIWLQTFFSSRLGLFYLIFVF